MIILMRFGGINGCPKSRTNFILIHLFIFNQVNKIQFLDNAKTITGRSARYSKSPLV